MIVGSGQLTAPQLPKEHYFVFAVLPERNMPLKKAHIHTNSSSEVAIVSDYFAKRAKQKLEKRKATSSLTFAALRSVTRIKPAVADASTSRPPSSASCAPLRERHNNPAAQNRA
ncbi:MAG: hypothetical protein QME60_06285 [Verrucomicrobiota bacterium]|nr:hypothetical protein [Verrucomicrobiota bacterium]